MDDPISYIRTWIHLRFHCQGMVSMTLLGWAGVWLGLWTILLLISPVKKIDADVEKGAALISSLLTLSAWMIVEGMRP